MGIVSGVPGCLSRLSRPVRRRAGMKATPGSLAERSPAPACCIGLSQVFHFNIFQRFSFDFTLFYLIFFEDDNDLPFPNEKSFGTSGRGGGGKIYFSFKAVETG